MDMEYAVEVLIANMESTNTNTNLYQNTSRVSPMVVYDPMNHDLGMGKFILSLYTKPYYPPIRNMFHKSLVNLNRGRRQILKHISGINQ
jgi:hypothetical protein